MRERLAFALLPSRAAAIALNAFALLGLVLAATGVHGVLAMAVSKRRRELAIRAAVGATRWDLLRAALWPTSVLVGGGCVIGAALSLAAARVLSAVVSNIPAQDPKVLLATGGTITAIAAIAALLSGAARDARQSRGRVADGLNRPPARSVP